MIRVGRVKFGNHPTLYPTYPDFTSIVVLMSGHNEWGVLGPYDLVNEDGVIMENFWQFSKVYEKVPRSKQTFSRSNKTIVWDHFAEQHLIDGELTRAYFDWRSKGMQNGHAVRYPVGFHHRHECKYALAYEPDKSIDPVKKLDYVESRKKIYVKEYCRLVKRVGKFEELKHRLDSGENLLIIEVDGPHQESLDYYRDKYRVGDDFIDRDSTIVNESNIRIMLNDEKHAFGHGYCLAMALLDKEDEWSI